MSRAVHLATAIVVAAVICTGCKEQPPEPRHPGVVPASVASYPVPYRKSDTAQWIDFRNPDEPAETAGAGDGGGGDVKAQIREFLGDYNAVAAEQDYEELLLYHVESQREDLLPLFKFGKEMLDRLGDLKAALVEALPDKEDEVNNVFASMEAMSSRSVEPQELEVVSPTEATATIGSGMMKMGCRFVMTDGEWSMELLGPLPDAATIEMQVSAARAGFDQMIQGIKSGAIPAEAVLSQMDALKSSLAFMGGAAPPATDDQGTNDDDSGEGE